MINVTVSGDDMGEIGGRILATLENEHGNLYPTLTRDVQEAINRNADPSYAGSEALSIALESAQSWQHQSGRHLLDIESTLLANYRQYGCGGMPITILVDLVETDMETMAVDLIEAVMEAV